jgi:phospholipase/lecithinase/hemolysin
MKWLRCLLLLSVIAVSNQIAAAYSGIDFFGDSLTDVGNVWMATTWTDPEHVKPLCPEYWNGRFCNGPNYADQLSAYLGLPAPRPAILGGNDYAWGGAGTATAGTSTLNTPNLGEQVTTYLTGLSGNRLDPGRLVVVWAGGNDPIYEKQTNFVQSAANVADAVSRLANEAGAKNILVNNLPLLGNTPAAIAQGTDVQNALNGWTLGFNYYLKNDLATLRTSLPSDVTILESLPGKDDIYTQFNDIIADPSLYGITNVAEQAYQTTDSGIPGILVPNSEHYLFWDFVHPTTYAVGVLVPEPSTLVMFLGLGIFVAASRVRRQAK